MWWLWAEQDTIALMVARVSYRRPTCECGPLAPARAVELLFGCILSSSMLLEGSKAQSDNLGILIGTFNLVSIYCNP